MDRERQKRGIWPKSHSHRSDRACEESDVDADDRPIFVPRIAAADVYHEMIASEVRNGRLTRARRRRIVRYAAQLGLSAVEAGRLVTKCREQALESDDPAERQHALHLVEPEPARMPIAFKLAIVVAMAVLVDFLVIAWRW
jgi:hypothetical protein